MRCGWEGITRRSNTEERAPGRLFRGGLPRRQSGESSVRRPRVVSRGGPMGWSWIRPRMTRARRVQVTSCPFSRWGSSVPSRMSRWIRWSATACRASYCRGVSGLSRKGWAAAGGCLRFRGPLVGGVVPRGAARGAGRGAGGSWRVAGVGGCVGRSWLAGLLEGPCGVGGVPGRRPGRRCGLAVGWRRSPRRVRGARRAQLVIRWVGWRRGTGLLG